jgi:hypothetical protein
VKGSKDSRRNKKSGKKRSDLSMPLFAKTGRKNKNCRRKAAQKAVKIPKS